MVYLTSCYFEQYCMGWCILNPVSIFQGFNIAADACNYIMVGVEKQYVYILFSYDSSDYERNKQK